MAAVNRPTDVKQKEADINQKLQLYGIYSGMYEMQFNLVLPPTTWSRHIRPLFVVAKTPSNCGRTRIITDVNT